MGLTGFNKRRAELAKQEAEQQAEQPTEPVTEQAPPGDTVAPLPFALQYINAAKTVEDLQPLPTVGKKAAEVLLAKRPETGYESVAQAKELANLSFVNWDEIASWEG